MHKNSKIQYFMLELGGYDNLSNPITAGGNTSYVKFDRRWSFDHVINEALELAMQRNYKGVIIYADTLKKPIFSRMF